MFGVLLGCASILFLSSVAIAQFSGGGSTTVNIPLPNVDWFARIVSGLAFIVSAARFAWGRIDKSRERTATRARRDPSVDLDITRGNRSGNFDFELTVVNRGDVSVQLVSLSASKGAMLVPDDADVTSDKTVADYNGLRIERGKEDTVVGEVNLQPGKSGTIEFTVKIRVNEAAPRILTTVLKRELKSKL